jgi:hypothetical protein
MDEAVSERGADVLIKHAAMFGTRNRARHLLRGLDVVLCPRADEEGERYIAGAARCLEGYASKIRVLRLFDNNGMPRGIKSADSTRRTPKWPNLCQH